MANMSVPTDLLERLQADSKKPRAQLTRDEREMLALRLEWLAAEVREKPVREADWSQDREIGEPSPSGAVAAGPWQYTITVQMWDW